MIKKHSIKDLAQLLHIELVGEFACEGRMLASKAPSYKSLVDLFDTVFSASLKREEGQSLTFSILHVEPSFQLPLKSHQYTSNTPWYISFQDSIPLNVSNLVKLARATDPRSSALLIYHDQKGNLFIWGIVDQEANWNDIINLNTDMGVVSACNFRLVVNGPGIIDLFIEFEKIASLQVDMLTTIELDIFSDGPVLKHLKPGIKPHLKAVMRRLKMLAKENGISEADLSGQQLYAVDDWIGSLCRLLNRIRGFRHGGAFLITPDVTKEWLNIKYKLQYSRLKSALETHAVTQSFYWMNHIELSKQIQEGNGQISHSLANRQMTFRMKFEDSVKELDSCLWFIALLSRVDGLILLNQDLIVQGFGVEITCAELPENIVSSKRVAPKSNQLKQLNYTDYGTRHRSMMRYCFKVPGSIGFVISQDGDIRAITRVRDHLMIWENIKVTGIG